MSSKTVTTHFCDICGQVIHDYSKRNRMSIGVRFLTEQNEGTPVKPYYDYCIVDLCDECADRAITVDAIGAMGHNEYRWHKKPRAQYGELESENAKLRDAMYANAGKRSLQHMDEDELRIWATQQSEYIEELKELAREMRSDLLPTTCPWVDEYDKRMRELGVEVE